MFTPSTISATSAGGTFGCQVVGKGQPNEAVVEPALQLPEFGPPPLPRQIQFHGPPPDIGGDAVPVLHAPAALAAPALAKLAPLAPPQAPVTAAAAKTAVQTGESDPLPLPRQVHVHGPLPETTVAVPVLHKIAPLGAAAKLPPFAVPQAPFTAAAILALQPTLFPEGTSVQVQFHGPLPPTAEALPALHKLTAGALAKVPPLEVPHCGQFLVSVGFGPIQHENAQLPILDC